MEYPTDVMTKMDGLYAVIPLTNFRNTPGVMFDFVPKELVSRINSIDRVIHANAAISPGAVKDVDRPISIFTDRMWRLESLRWCATDARTRSDLL